MRTSLLPGLLLSIACCAQASVDLPSAGRTQVPETEVNSTRNAIREAFFDVNNNEWEAAAAAFEGAIHSSGFADLPEELRYPTLLTAGQIAEKAGKHELAHGLLVQAT